MNIGATIKRLRTEHGLTQQQLAEYLSVSMQTISRWETSVTYPDVIMLPILAKRFNVTIDYLLNIGGTVMKTIEMDRLLVREWEDSDATRSSSLKRTHHSLFII
jgi:transcriptional regulator with XRE-family HTH domain